MKINWKVRFKNPVFWFNLAASIFRPMLACLGFHWEDMTSWQAVGNVLLQAVQSPVIVVSVLVSVWNLLNDPTTSGLSDSSQALSYTEPKKSE